MFIDTVHVGRHHFLLVSDWSFEFFNMYTLCALYYIILYRGLEHLRILVSKEAPGTNPAWIPRGNSIPLRLVASITTLKYSLCFLVPFYMFLVLLFPFEESWPENRSLYVDLLLLAFHVVTTWQATVKDDRVLEVIFEALSSKAATFSKQFEKLWTDCVCTWRLVLREAWVLIKDFQICVERDESIMNVFHHHCSLSHMWD